jgi:hypothetical protein
MGSRRGFLCGSYEHLVVGGTAIHIHNRRISGTLVPCQSMPKIACRCTKRQKVGLERSNHRQSVPKVIASSRCFHNLAYSWTSPAHNSSLEPPSRMRRWRPSCRTRCAPYISRIPWISWIVVVRWRTIHWRLTVGVGLRTRRRTA